MNARLKTTDWRGRRPVAFARRGFSLLELLLGMALGMLVIGAVVGLYVGGARGYALTSGQARLQESARLGLHFVAASARGAGYFGCGAGGKLLDGLDGAWRGAVISNVATPVAGVDNLIDAGDVAGWNLGDRQFKPDSDVVLFRRIAGVGHDLARPFDATGRLALATAYRPRPGQLAVLSGCGRLGLLAVDAIDRRSGRVTLRKSVDVEALEAAQAPFGGPAGPESAVLAAVLTEVYFVARSRFVNNQGTRGWSLWRHAGRADEVVLGIEDLQILYGVDFSPDDLSPAPSRYVSAAGIGSGLVRTVRITMTASSVDAVADGVMPLTQTVSQTVALRNPWVGL